MGEIRDYTKKEWGTRVLTMQGTLHAAEDIICMGFYLYGGLAGLRYLTPFGIWIDPLQAFVMAGSIFLISTGLIKFMNLLNPRNHYETSITINGNTKIC